MSGANAEPRDTAESQAPPDRPAESPAGVLGVGLGLLLLIAPLGLLAWIALGPEGESAEDIVARWLPEPRPFGLELEDDSRYPQGDRMLRLVPTEADGEVDAPEAVLLGIYARPGAVKDLFRRDDDRDRNRGQDSRLSRWQDDPDFAWRAEVDRGEVTWDGWRAAYVRTRAFAEGGGWSEATHVNLSHDRNFLVLFALWPPETEGSEAQLRRLLAAVDLPPEQG